MSADLKPLPCPWCGGEAVTMDGYYNPFVKCLTDDCHAIGPAAPSDDPKGPRWADKAVAAWNELALLATKFAFADKLLRRVVISGGAGRWTQGEMSDWCCDYKLHSLGYSGNVALTSKSHDACAHRTAFSAEQLGQEANHTRVAALEAEVAELRKHVEKAEARVATLEAIRDRHDTAREVLREIVAQADKRPTEHTRSGKLVCPWCGDLTAHPKLTNCPIHQARSWLAALLAALEEAKTDA